MSVHPTDSVYCCYCEKNCLANYSKDHLVPKVKGGKNIIHNKRPCCHTCNGEKGYSYLEEYLAYLSKKEPTDEIKVKIAKVKYWIVYVRSAGQKLFKDDDSYQCYLNFLRDGASKPVRPETVKTYTEVGRTSYELYKYKGKRLVRFLASEIVCKESNTHEQVNLAEHLTNEAFLTRVAKYFDLVIQENFLFFSFRHSNKGRLIGSDYEVYIYSLYELQGLDAAIAFFKDTAIKAWENRGAWLNLKQPGYKPPEVKTLPMPAHEVLNLDPAPNFHEEITAA